MEYWIIFADGDSRLSRFLHDKFSHIEILTRDRFSWILLKPTSKQFFFKILPHPAKQNIVKKLKNCHVIYVKTRGEAQGSFLFPFRPATCVEVVKYIIGLHKFVITPRGLFKSLIKMEVQKTYPSHIKKIELLKEIS